MSDAQRITSQKISRELAKIFLGCYRDSENVLEFIDDVAEKSGTVFTRYILVAVYYALDMMELGEGEN